MQVVTCGTAVSKHSKDLRVAGLDKDDLVCVVSENHSAIRQPNMPNKNDTVESCFVTVAELSQLPDGGFLRVLVDYHALVLARDGDAVFAFQRTCPHEKADLAQGRIECGRLICPRHLASFDLAEGQVSRGWKLDALKLYPVRVEGGAVAIDADAVRRKPPGGDRKVWDFTPR